MTTIDVHCHFIPPALVDQIRAEGPAHSVELREADDGSQVSFAGRDTTRGFPDGMLDLEDRLRWMDAGGIDVQVVSPWMDFSAYVLDAEAGVWLARGLNECTAEAIAGRPDRFKAMAAVPLQAPDLAAAELRYAIQQLGMKGVEIATSVVDRELDDPALHPFWEACEELEVIVLIHPYQAIGSQRLYRYFLWNIVGNPAEETVAAAFLIYGGVLQRHPRLKVCLTHGGGFLPYQIGRQDRGFDAIPKATRKTLGDTPSKHLRSFYYDTITHDPQALEFLVARVGSDRVMLGSDYPFPMGDPDPASTVARCNLEEQKRVAVLGANAARAFGFTDEAGGALQ